MLSVSAMARDNPFLLVLAVKCWQLCTVIRSSVHLNQSCPDVSAFCRFMRAYIYKHTSDVVRKFPLTPDVSGMPLHVVYGVSRDYSQPWLYEITLEF